MALRLIIGGSGSGKSETVYRELIDRSMAEPQRRFFLIVPEQFTLQTQRHITERHPHHAVMNIEVVSFDRLAHRVFEELGSVSLDILDDAGKSMLIRRILGEVQGEIHTFRGNIRRQGFVDEVKSILSELMQYRVTPDMLREVRAKLGSDGRLYSKLADIECIYRAFLAAIEGRFATAEEVPERLCAVIGRSRLVAGSVIYLDNFTGFTPSQYQVLIRLLELAEEVIITMPVDAEAAPYHRPSQEELFFIPKDTIAQLEQICREYRIPRGEDSFPEKDRQGRYDRQTALYALSKRIYRMGQPVFDGDAGTIMLSRASDPAEEMRMIAARIHDLVSRGGLRYREIAVVAGDPEEYRRLASACFAAYDIPCFFDDRRRITDNMLIRWMDLVFAMLRGGFKTQDMAMYLKSSFSGFELAQADRMENYMLARGIRGMSRLQKPWTVPAAGMTEAELVQLDGMRADFAAQLRPLYALSRKQTVTVTALLRALFELMRQLEIKAQLQEQVRLFECEGDLSRAREYAQIYDVVIELMEEMHRILGSSEVSIREFQEIFEAGICQKKIGIIPPGLDQVTFGDIKRTRLEGIRYLFFAGVNEGLVPFVPAGGGILTDTEREQLKLKQLTLAPGSRDALLSERYYIYAVMTKPSDGLMLSYSECDTAGKERRPSGLIRQLHQLFPKLTEHTAAAALEALEDRDILRARHRIVRELPEAAEGRTPSEFWQQLYTWFASEPSLSGRLEKLTDAAFYRYAPERLSRAAAAAVYGRELYGSVTMLENYASCAYGHFLRYGLRLREREIYRIQTLDIGNIYHAALQHFSESLALQGLTWRSIKGSERDRMARESLLLAAADCRHDLIHDTERLKYQEELMVRTMQRTVWALQQQILRGDFDPAGYEVAYKGVMLSESGDALDGGSEAIRLSGKIDRIDAWEDPEGHRKYFKIIDYKSGSTKFELQKVYYGLQLQLIVYMTSVIKEERAKAGEGTLVLPAGILYYHIDDPIIDSTIPADFVPGEGAGADTAPTLRDAAGQPETAGADPAVPPAADPGCYSEEEIRILEALVPDGLLAAEGDVLRHLDREMGIPPVIPVKLKNDGSPTQASKATAIENFELLSRHVAKQLEDYSGGIMDGDISVAPYKLGKSTPCGYCAYHSVCGFDEGLAGYSYRRLPDIEDEQVWEAIGKEAATWK